MATQTNKGKKKKRPWQYYNILIHRYLGYLFLGITIVYAISGLAVNHMEDWNSNFIMHRQSITIEPLTDPENLTPEDAQAIFKQFKLNKAVNPDNIFYPDEDKIEILISSNETVRISTLNWKTEHELIQRRPFLHLFNFLHLNNAKKAWTFYADVYAIALLLMAITGLFMKKGKKGIWGEAGVWTVAGMIFPTILVFMYYQ